MPVIRRWQASIGAQPQAMRGSLPLFWHDASCDSPGRYIRKRLELLKDVFPHPAG